MAGKLRRALLAGAAIVGFALLADFVAVNWVLGCETWDRELWTEEHSCLAPSDVWDGVVSAVVGKAQAGEYDTGAARIRRERRDYERRISPSWDVRLRQMDRERRREEREDRRREQEDWYDLTHTEDER